MTLGKMLGGGVPLGALVATEAVSCFEHGDQGGTFNGNPLMAAVGCAVIDEVLKPGLLENVRTRSVQLQDGLGALSKRHILREARGRGLLLALDLGCNHAPKVVELAREAGLLLDAPRPHVLRFMPALNVSQEEADRMLDTLECVIRQALAE